MIQVPRFSPAVTVNNFDFKQFSNSSLVVVVAKAAFNICRIAGKSMPALFFS